MNPGPRDRIGEKRKRVKRKLPTTHDSNWLKRHNVDDSLDKFFHSKHVQLDRWRIYPNKFH